MKVKDVYDKIAEGWYHLHQWPRKFILEDIKKWKGKILDIGCGNAQNFLIFKDRKDVELIGTDISGKMLEYAKKYSKKHKIRARFHVMDARKLDFEDNSVDNILCIGVLQHFPKKEHKKILKEITRVLRPGGNFIISVLDKNWEKIRERTKKEGKEVFLDWTFKGITYKRYYYYFDIEELKQILKSAGFKIIKRIPDKKNICFLAKLKRRESPSPVK